MANYRLSRVTADSLVGSDRHRRSLRQQLTNPGTFPASRSIFWPMILDTEHPFMVQVRGLLNGGSSVCLFVFQLKMRGRQTSDVQPLRGHVTLHYLQH
jgi:hypothetical protein